MKDFFKMNKPSWSMLPEWYNIERKQVYKLVSFMLVFAVLNLTIGCNSYFRINSSYKPSNEIIKNL